MILTDTSSTCKKLRWIKPVNPTSLHTHTERETSNAITHNRDTNGMYLANILWIRETSIVLSNQCFFYHYLDRFKISFFCFWSTPWGGTPGSSVQ